MPKQSSPPDPQPLIDYWVDEIGPKGWYAGTAEIDEAIRARFLPLWERAVLGQLEGWLSNPDGSLAYLILTDQFPRNMFRDDHRAFATDKQALAAATKAIHRRWDMRVAEPQRQFFYLPLMHSESQADQDRCVRLMLTRMPESGHVNMLHARAHRAVIRQFGRFPYRNAALGRESTPEEVAYLAAGGYGRTVADLQAQKAA